MCDGETSSVTLAAEPSAEGGVSRRSWSIGDYERGLWTVAMPCSVFYCCSVQFCSLPALWDAPRKGIRFLLPFHFPVLQTGIKTTPERWAGTAPGCPCSVNMPCMNVTARVCQRGTGTGCARRGRSFGPTGSFDPSWLSRDLLFSKGSSKTKRNRGGFFADPGFLLRSPYG